MKDSKAFIVVGLGYGDEGKGSIVDFLAREHGAFAAYKSKPADDVVATVSELTNKRVGIASYGPTERDKRIVGKEGT